MNETPPTLEPITECPRCGKAPATRCGYLARDGWASPPAYRCTAGGVETINPSRSCKGCPLVWCSACTRSAHFEREAAY
jgi:hypothetical protein